MLKIFPNLVQEIGVKETSLILLLVGYCFIPIAPAPVNIAIFSSLLIATLSSEVRARYRFLFGEPVFFWFFVFYGLLMISSLYGPGSWILKLNYLGKYLEMGYMPLLAAILYEKKYRNLALRVFSFVMALTLMISYLLYFGLPFSAFNLSWIVSGDIENPTVFKLQITHNFFMALAVFLWLQEGLRTQRFEMKLVYWLACCLGIINVLIMIGGRTGYVALFALALALLLDTANFKKILIGLIVCCVSVIGAYEFIPKVQNKINLGVIEAKNWTPNQGSDTSIGLRLDFWNASYQMIKKAPIFGSGIAGYEEGSKQISEGTTLNLGNNPHNQYLLFLTQIGFFGLLTFLWLNYVMWVESSRLERPWRLWVRGIILAYAAANLFNSMLLDFSEGIFFSASLAISFSCLLDEKTHKKSLR